MTATTSRGVKCGNCKAYHPSADDVRFCYQTSTQFGIPGTVATVRTTHAHDVDAEATDEDVNQAALRAFGGPAATKTAQPSRTLPAADVPAGYYAIDSLSGNNDLDFYKVDRPTEGKWAGYTFVNQVVGGHPDFSVKNRDRRNEILHDIEVAGVQESALLYGREIGRCCRCNRHLTDETSRAYGMGPDCREIAGW